MQRIGFILLIIGVGVLLMSSGAGAVSVGLVDGNHDSKVVLDFKSVAPGYNFGYMDGHGFHNIVSSFSGRATREFIGVSVVNFALQALSNPSNVLTAGVVFFNSQVAPNVYHAATLQFSGIQNNVTFAVARNSPPDGLVLALPATPNPEPETLVLLSSIMGVGYVTLHTKLRNRQGKRAV